MVKLIYCLRRLPTLSLEEFQHYWRTNHGPLVQSVAEVTKTRRYVQSHTIPDERMEAQRQALGRPEPFDGVAMLWWDSVADFAPPERTKEREKAGLLLHEDEQRFIDLARSPLWLAEEIPVITALRDEDTSARPSSRVKIVYCGRRLPNLTRDEFQQYWRTDHGPLVKSHEDVLRIRRYVQSHTAHDEVNERMRTPLSRPLPYDGVAELWWESMEDRQPSNPDPKRVQAAHQLFEDEKKFVDHGQSPVFLTKEYVFINR